MVSRAQDRCLELMTGLPIFGSFRVLGTLGASGQQRQSGESAVLRPERGSCKHAAYISRPVL
eukprot:5495068-Amphidinium_carterae.1